MEEKKTIKISFTTLFLILAIIIIMIMAFYMYIDKTNSNKEIAELKININNMQNTINSLQKEIRIEKSNNLNTTTTNSNNKAVSNKEVSFTDEQVKTALTDFLELQAHSNCDRLLENLTKKGNLNYSPYETTTLYDGTVITKIKFADYKEAMLNYVSESEFEKNWHSTQNINENSDGYLNRLQGGGGLITYTIKNIIKNGDLNYSANTSYVTEDNETYNKDFTFTVKSYNGKCVIDSIK